MTNVRPLVPGLLLVIGVASVATALGLWAPVVGAPVLALLAGAALGAFRPRAVEDGGACGPGLAFARRRLLPAAIVLLGLGLPFDAVLRVGHSTGVVLLGTAVIGSLAALVVGRLLALDRESATLVAVGTTICGASAIAAATAVMRPRRAAAAYALGTIFVFNIVAVLVFPPVGRLLSMSDEGFGLWAGTAINDTSSVLAAGVVFGPAAAQFAVIVKLVRSLLIVPMCLGLHLERRRASGTGRFALRRVFPLFVPLFVAASVLAGTGLIPAVVGSASSRVSAWLIAGVCVAVGTSLTWERVRRAGARPLLFGGILSVVLAVGSLALACAGGWR
ncbi:YeiH family protein [Nocardia sp. BMG51109]|uniref:YeiH family protein n=1 Tax=Nocardia sp. BMG51109 TaxID=1056816 RepID=UPI0004636452|nr:putative sulfate exporter family transporter [Nocardia sp. BMG51109]